MCRPLCFAPVIYLFIIYLLFFALWSSWPKNVVRRDFSQDVRMWCNFITETCICIPMCNPSFWGRKSPNFAPQLGDGATLNSCNLKTRLQIEKLKQMRLFLTITVRFLIRQPCSCWERCAVFSDPNCTRATFSQFPPQHSAEGATYIRRAAITFGIGPHSSFN